MKKNRINLLGLGDVGSMLAIGLKLLGGDVLDEIGIFDLDENRISRWEMELNQIISNENIKIKKVKFEDLFDCDVFVFCASKMIPQVGSKVDDVRMIQFKENRKIVEMYGKIARDIKFQGIFAVVSDPVDLLCKAALVASNTNEEGIEDELGLNSHQIRGYGLGVMDGRAKYYSDSYEMNYRSKGRVYGPHGKDLIVVDDIENYDHEKSIKLTNSVIRANLDLRAVGYKPFIAPALSSGAVSILDTLRGNWHYSATYQNGVYFGQLNKNTSEGIEYENHDLDDQIKSRIKHTYERLDELWKMSNL